MIRKLVLPALAALLLAGCASYQYRGGAGGDYYYGQPGTEYRYYGYPYGGYGYGSYGYPSYFGYRSYYSYPYGYGGYYRPPYYGPRPGHGHGHGHGHGGNHGGGNAGGGNPDPGQPPPTGNDNQEQPKAPWRNLERLQERARVHDQTRRPAAEPSNAPYRRTAPTRTTPVRPGPPPQRSEVIRRSTPAVQSRSIEPRTVSPRARTIQKRDRGPTTEL